MVGRMFARVLTERKIRARYILFNRAGGADVEIGGKLYKTNALNEHNVRAKGAYDYALFSAGADVSRQFAPLFAKLGAVVIDNSSAWRRDVNVPLVIPECNIASAIDHENNTRNGSQPHGRIIANPNCTTIGSLPALKPLDDEYGLKRVVYASYQAISGAGANPKFLYPIDNNVIPYIAGEEEKMAHETNKILRGVCDKHGFFAGGAGRIEVSATCIRVPVKNCHTVAIHAEFSMPVNIDRVREILSRASGVVLLPEGDLPMPIVANGHDEIFVGRVRIPDGFGGCAVDMVTASDNIRKGAATNAVQILQKLLQQ